MKRSTKPTRYNLGLPYDAIIAELLKSTNTGNLSANWNPHDMVRYALYRLWMTEKKRPFPKAAQAILPRFYADLDM